MINSPTFETALAGMIDGKIAGIFTAMPGRVESYNSATQKAVILPLVKVAHTDENGARVAREIAPLVDVPIQFPGMGQFRITMPVNSGDIVLLIFASCSLDRWLSSGGVTDPGDDRHHDLSDAIAIPGLYSFNRLPTDASQAAMVLHGEEIRLGSSSATDGVAMKSDLDALKSFLTSAPDGLAYGTGLKTALNASAWPVCSQKVKAE